MPKSLRRFTFTSIVLASIYLLAGGVQLFAQQDLKLKYYEAQYRALRMEGKDLWQAALAADLTQELQIRSLYEKIFDFKKKIDYLGTTVGKYAVEQDKSLTTRISPRFHLIYNTCRALSNMLDQGMNYLLERDSIYIKVAFKYEEAWRILDEAVGQ